MCHISLLCHRQPPTDVVAAAAASAIRRRSRFCWWNGSVQMRLFCAKVEKCNAVYVCRNHLFFHGFTRVCVYVWVCGALVDPFRYCESTKIETQYSTRAFLCKTHFQFGMWFFLDFFFLFWLSQHLDIKPGQISLFGVLCTLLCIVFVLFPNSKLPS